MDPITFWYGLTLLLGLVAPYALAAHEAWESGLAPLPAPKRASKAAKWGAIYAIVAFAFCIDIAGVPVRKDWGLTLLGAATICPALVAWIRFRKR